MIVDQVSLPIVNKPSSLDWVGNRLIDWTGAGTLYDPENEGNSFNKYSFGSRFDGVKSIANGKYVILFERLGTKGLILKEGNLIREINRSYYHSGSYEYPLAIFENRHGTFIVHCPDEYCVLEIEEIESGERINSKIKREPKDSFYSRLTVSPDNKYLISAGWVWHPFDVLHIFDLNLAFDDIRHLDSQGIDKMAIEAETSSASFIDDSHVLLSSSREEPIQDEFHNLLEPGNVGIIDLREKRLIRSLSSKEEVGNLAPINFDFAWDFFDYPKIIDLHTGEAIYKMPSISSGQQNSSIIHHIEFKSIAVSECRRKVAIAQEDKVDILTIQSS